MNISPEIVSAFLSGSIGTVVLREVISIFTKRQEHRRLLQRITYERKLELAEKAIGFYWGYQNKVAVLKQSMELMLHAIEKQNSEIDFDMLQNNIRSAGREISIIDHSLQSEVNAANLYFDLDNSEKWSEGDLRDLMESMASTKHFDNQIGSLFELQKSCAENGNHTQAEHYGKQILTMLPHYTKSLSTTIDLFEKNQTASSDFVRKIKKQLKQY